MRKILLVLLYATTLVGCAHGKMGTVDQRLDSGVLTKDTPIFIEVIRSNSMRVQGEKSDDAVRIDAEKTTIEAHYHSMIAEALRKKGYKAQSVNEPKSSGVVISGQVTRFDHGSAAARFWVGMGAGSSNMFTDITIEDRTNKKTLSKFEVIATSGGRGGVYAWQSFLDGHIEDGANQISSYINGEVK